MKLIDTHNHLYSEEFDTNRAELVREAIESGIEKILLPNIDASSIKAMHNVCDTWPDFAYPMMGLHPTSVDGEVEEQLSTIKSFFNKRKYCGIGEIGIDLYWDKTFLHEQQYAFEEQLKWAMELNLPVAIHTREAFPEVLNSLHKVGNNNLCGVFHSFTGNESELKALLEFKNFKIGINGVITFKNSKLSQVLKQTSIDRIVLETDAPYLAPAPYRGRTNLPVYIWKTAEKVADTFDLSVKETVEITSSNALELFKCVSNPV